MLVHQRVVEYACPLLLLKPVHQADTKISPKPIPFKGGPSTTYSTTWICSRVSKKNDAAYTFPKSWISPWGKTRKINMEKPRTNKGKSSSFGGPSERLNPGWWWVWDRTIIYVKGKDHLSIILRYVEKSAAVVVHKKGQNPPFCSHQYSLPSGELT